MWMGQTGGRNAGGGGGGGGGGRGFIQFFVLRGRRLRGGADPRRHVNGRGCGPLGARHAGSSLSRPEGERGRPAADAPWQGRGVTSCAARGAAASACVLRARPEGGGGLRARCRRERWCVGRLEDADGLPPGPADEHPHSEVEHAEHKAPLVPLGLQQAQVGTAGGGTTHPAPAPP